MDFAGLLTTTEAYAGIYAVGVDLVCNVPVDLSISDGVILYFYIVFFIYIYVVLRTEGSGIGTWVQTSDGSLNDHQQHWQCTVVDVASLR